MREDYLYHNIIGISSEIEATRDFIRRIGPVNVDVFITGESGTGKDLVARCLHKAWKPGGPFVEINCAAFDSLAESELFGHERGAFTGAERLRRGKFELADKGSLFLDEVAEASLSLQAKLLRAVEQKKFFRLGGEKPVSSDCRLISATNADLSARVKDGRFRPDLLYRLRKVHIHVPPLRSRPEDIPVLSQFFMKEASVRFQRYPKGFTSGCMEQMRLYSWPGNVRELRNTVHGAVVLCSGPYITSEDVFRMMDIEQAALANRQDSGSAYSRVMNETEKGLIMDCLDQTRGNMSATSRNLGMALNTLKKKMKIYGIEKSVPAQG